jgi:hypothetical protein
MPISTTNPTAWTIASVQKDVPAAICAENNLMGSNLMVSKQSKQKNKETQKEGVTDLHERLNHEHGGGDEEGQRGG